MNSVADTRGTPAQEAAPRTSLGGPITLQGKQYATTAELEEALAGAVQDAGVYSVRLTPKGEQLAAQLAAEARR